MLQEAIDAFEIKVSNNERIIIDSHTLKPGTYRLIEMNETDNWNIKKTLDIYFDKKTKEMIGQADEDYFFIQQLDYYSKIINTNKAIDTKKRSIHSNNYLSLAVKAKTVDEGNLTNQVIEKYFNLLKNPNIRYGNPKKSREIYEELEKKIGRVDVHLAEKIENYILTHKVFEGIDLKNTNYIKIFFIFTNREKTIKYYKRERDRYLIPNLFVQNKYNINDNGTILGVPNNNIHLNEKKPFLENRTRKVKVPYLLNQQDALLRSQFFDYMLGEVSKGKYNFYIDNLNEENGIRAYTDKEVENCDVQSGYYLRCSKGTNEVEIIHADNVIGYSGILKKPFVLKNYIGISKEKIDKSSERYDVKIDQLKQVYNLIDSTFFEGKLHTHLYSDVENIKINDSVLKRCILENRDLLLAWVYEGKMDFLKPSFDKFSIELIKNSVRKNEVFNVRKQFNLRWSLLEYFDDERKIGENIMNVRKILKEHINSKKNVDWDFENDEEFAYGIGQIIAYFLSLNKSKNKSSAFINQFLNAKNVNTIKEKIEVMYKKYNYAIEPFNGGRFQQLMEHIMIYEPQKIRNEYLIAGFSAGILIYEENKEEDNNE